MLQERYRIVEHVGKGGMGSVYKAVYTTQAFSTTYAIKVTQADTSQTHISKAFESEANLLAQLRHPALPRVADYFVQNDQLFLVMDFIEGADLATLLEQRGAPFPVDDVLGWADKLLDALEYLHTQDPPIIHRDIKPQNLKLDPQGNLYLLDFGLAKGAEGTLLSGYTAHYAPLEQFQGLGTDARGDIYSLAATLHHLLTNVDPRGATMRASVVLSGGEKQDPQKPAHELNPQVPESISTVLTRAMAIQPEKRYNNTTEMRVALHDAQNQTGFIPPPEPPSKDATQFIPPPSQPGPIPGTQRLDPPDSASTPKPPPPTRKPPVILGVVLLLLLLVGGGGAAWYSGFIFNGEDNGENGSATATVEAPAPANDTTEAQPTTTVVPPPTTNSQIVFVSDRDGSQDIFIMDADGANPTNLTSSPAADETEPALSPDGTRIAFEENDDIVVINTDGSNRTNLTGGQGENESPTWSPASDRIAFVSDDLLTVMNADGSGRTPISDEPGSYDDLDWSPTGEQLVFERDAEIFVINLDGSGLTNLSNTDARDVEPAWSPDGSQIAFASDREANSFDVFVMNAGGRSVSRVTEHPATDRAPTWSPDGTQMAFRSGRDRGNPEIYVMNTDGSNQTNLTNTPEADDTNPVWAP
jgi:serine/threonine protein kinase